MTALARSGRVEVNGERVFPRIHLAAEHTTRGSAAKVMQTPPGWWCRRCHKHASAFDFGWDSQEHVQVSAKVIHRMSYRFPPFLVR